ncbi:hypothetical protein JANAI62_37000 [Jannaschia pagri]|uniref:Ca2+-binding protein, RTX toxin-related n=1 Tax=Jannaschia pagri TaxID=2829797 RepID=A0ABQ4NSH7_9RHOB|nr:MULTISPECIES: calcium-binding protein [unclassified Jannaschia]GIT93256.1 hypothetical protein JANAI61_37140 [Jannaschia sp. AI_61]GIT97077.1 hypothetical protein JANAI62_37000 [Jannaschia sp. AI_62]
MSAFDTQRTEINAGVTRGFDIATLTDGRTIVLWNTDANVRTVDGLVLDTTGAVVGDPLSFSDLWPVTDIKATDDGGFVLVSFRSNGIELGGDHPGYTPFDLDRTGSEIRLQAFDAAGQATTEVETVSAGDAVYQTPPKITQLPDGGFALVWSVAQLTPFDGQNASGGRYDGADPVVQLLDASFAPVGDLRVLPPAADDTFSDHDVTSVVTLQGGGFAYAFTAVDRSNPLTDFETRLESYIQVFDAAGEPIGDPIEARGSSPFEVVGSGSQEVQLIATSNGGFAAIWDTFFGPSFIQTFDATGQTIGARTQLLQSEFGNVAGLVEGEGGVLRVLSNQNFDIFTNNLSETQALAFDLALNPVHAAITLGTETLTDIELARLPDGTILEIVSKQGDGGGAPTLQVDTYDSPASNRVAGTVEDFVVAGTDQSDSLIFEDPRVTSIFEFSEGFLRTIDYELPGGVLLGRAGDDILSGGRNNDVLDGGLGADVMIGGRGSDLFMVDNAGDRVLESVDDAGRDTVVGSVDLDLRGLAVEEGVLVGTDDLSLTGSFRTVQLVGNAGSNVIAGGDRDELIVGGGGTDTISGGRGADTIEGDDTGVTVLYEHDDIDAGIVVDLSRSTARDGYGDTDLLLGVNGVTGTRFDDRIEGDDNRSPETFIGGAGNDTLLGKEGEDSLMGGDGVDLLDGGRGGDTLLLDNAAPTGAVVRLTETGEGKMRDGYGNEDVVISLSNVIGSIHNDDIFGHDGRNRLEDGGGSDLLRGGLGADTLVSTGMESTLNGGAGDDLYLVNGASTFIVEAGTEPGGVAQGNDTVRATVNVDLRGAEIETIILEGSANIEIRGSQTAARMVGNEGSNILAGFGGADTITGGEGVDYFAFVDTGDASEGPVRITDWSEEDILALDDQFFGLGSARISPRSVTEAQEAQAKALGQFTYDSATGEVRIDRDGRDGPEAAQLVAIIEGGGPIDRDDVLLF